MYFFNLGSINFEAGTPLFSKSPSQLQSLYNAV